MKQKIFSCCRHVVPKIQKPLKKGAFVGTVDLQAEGMVLLRKNNDVEVVVIPEPQIDFAAAVAVRVLDGSKKKSPTDVELFC